MNIKSFHFLFFICKENKLIHLYPIIRVCSLYVTYDKHEAWEMKIGDCVDLDGFVRKHEINKYSDIRETFINRVKVIENKGAAS